MYIISKVVFCILYESVLFIG